MKRQTKTKTIVLSFDGLGTTDWKIIEKLPGFAAFLKDAAYCKQVETVYPSLTYPAHCSIVTGRTPAHHGVVHNTLLQPRRLLSPDWHWQRSHIRGKTLYELAAEKGLTTAAFLWPVTAGAKIHYNIPEIFANRWWDNQIFASLRSGSPRLQAEVFARYGKLMRGITQPYLDNFLHEAVKYTLAKYQPDFSLIHYVDLDSMRHHYGHDSREALMALRRLDQKLAQLMQLMQNERVTWVLLGDHSSLDESRAIRLNRVLQRAGLLAGRQNRVQRYTVIMQGADGSAYLYDHKSAAAGGNQTEREALAARVRDLIQTFSDQHDQCIEAMYSGSEAGAMGADPTCLLMLEAKKGYYFQDTLEGPDIYEVTPQDCLHTPHMQMATHGYLPKKPGYTTVFAMRGENVRPGEVKRPMRLIDEGPTIAYHLGGALPEADGEVRKEFFYDHS